MSYTLRGRLESRLTALVPVVVALALAALLVPVAIPSWHVSLGKAFGDVTPVAIPAVALAMFASVQLVRGNPRHGRSWLAWRRRTSGSGSPVTCTTCSATR